MWWMGRGGGGGMLSRVLEMWREIVIAIGPGRENRGGRSIERAWEIDSTFGRVIGERG